MKNKELQERLKQFPDDLDVWMEIMILEEYKPPTGAPYPSPFQMSANARVIIARLKHGADRSVIQLHGEDEDTDVEMTLPHQKLPKTEPKVD